MTDTKREAASARARVIALYLPQFHPIPENDAWWGRGFTEWTNVARARPLFRGHHQPNLPGDLGYYDLRLPEIRAAQAELAHAHGVEAFCYWHYWFAGDRLLERPFAEVLRTGEPNFRFCLAWANQSWTGIWHGAPGRMLKQQTYPGRSDYDAHFRSVLPAFLDDRYVRVDGSPVFGIYRPGELPDPTAFTDRWRELAEDAGLPGLHFLGFTDDPAWQASHHGMDGAVVHSFSMAARAVSRRPIEKIVRRLELLSPDLVRSALTLTQGPAVYDYEELRLDRVFSALGHEQHPALIPNWDNTPRSGRGGYVLKNSTPERFGHQVEHVLRLLEARPLESRFLFIKSWNEWAEGNYLEPDLRFGRAWLDALASRVFM